MPNKKSSKKKTLTKQHGFIIGAVILVVIIVIGGIAVFGRQGDNKKETPTTTATKQTTQAPTTQAEPVKLINPLTGLEGFDATAMGKRPVAVVVENSPQARPQWGLCSPDILIEGVVEGGITRMLWLYADVNTIPKVGPVRSARHDFVEIAEGLDAIFVHWGWSYLAEDAINDRNVNNINGLNGKYFFRDKSRKVDSEHTGYTNGESIAKAISDKKFNTKIDAAYSTPFTFVKNNAPVTPTGGVCQQVAFAFSSGYKHEFKFNANEKVYYNYLNAKPMLEDGGKQMSATNVILIYCPVQKFGSSVLMEMDLSGGNGLYASNGGYEKITWKKGNTPGAMLKLFATDGSPLLLNPGKSYIGLVPAAQSEKTTVLGDSTSN